MSSQLPQTPSGQPPQLSSAAQQSRGVFSKIGALLKKMWGLVPKRLSLPATIALLTFLLLVAVVAIVWGMYLNDPNHVPWRHWMSGFRIAVVVILVALIPLVVYRALRLWLEGETSLFPDIDYAWKAGLRTLAEHGLSVESTPIFLVLGSADLNQERAIVDAAGLNLRVREVPEGPAPLHWYANPEGVYLFCGEASWLSALSTRVQKERQRAQASGLPGTARSGAGLSPVAPRPPSAQDAAGESHSAASRGTMMLQAYTPESASASTESEPATLAGSSQTARHGTMTLQAYDPTETLPAATLEADPSERVATQAQPAVLSPRESAKQVQRLAYVCQLLRAVRQPLCPINGIMTLLPFATVQGAAREIEELEKATCNDLATIRAVLGLRCPVTALVTGLEEERGFRELVRRVGRQRASAHRFGQRFNLRTLTSMEELSAYCGHVCGVFEDWIYTLFRDELALTRPGNIHLYGLLCKIRYSLKDRLTSILSEGFGYDPQEQGDDEAVLFSGCYFAATGATQDRQAFVKGVFDKLVEEQEQIQWTNEALKSERRIKRAASAGFVSVTILVASLVAMISYKLFS